MKLISYEASDGTKVEYLENDGFILPIDGYKITHTIDDNDKIDAIYHATEMIPEENLGDHMQINEEAVQKIFDMCKLFA